MLRAFANCLVNRVVAFKNTSPQVVY